MTAFQRTALDYHCIASSDEWRERVVNVEFVEGVASNLRQAQQAMQRLYLLSFLGASIILAGGLPTDAAISAFGIEMSASVLSLQAIGAVTAGIYSYFMGKFASATLSYGAVSAVLAQTYRESWDFFLARHDASMLYGTFFRPKRVGYQSPRRERVIAWSVALTAFGIVFLHFAVVAFACAVALGAAIEAGTTIPTVVASASLFSVIVAFLAYFAAAALPLPYRWKEERSSSTPQAYPEAPEDAGKATHAIEAGCEHPPS